MINRPGNNEFAPYYLKYVNSVPEGSITDTLSRQLEETVLLLKGVTEEQGQFRYASGKWTLKEVAGHLIDTERVMAYRLLCVARGESASLPGFDENKYVANASFHHQLMEQLVCHFAAVRQSTLLLLDSLDDEAWLRKGNANNFEVTVRALAYIIAGHERHHCRILKERYMNSDDFPILN